MYCHTLTYGTVIAIALVFGAVNWAGEKIPLDKLPNAVVKAVKERFPEGEMLSAEKEKDDGRLKYEVKVRNKGKKYEVEVTPDGKILEVEREDD
ncbi:MAG: PepSY domain-containing protein [Gemmataceae bacterium]|jgi:uncharacterized membrane protein YkoI|nr:PepSY domain-containing protein [Gemmataceae bacterium]